MAVSEHIKEAETLLAEADELRRDWYARASEGKLRQYEVYPELQIREKLTAAQVHATLATAFPPYGDGTYYLTREGA